MSKYNKMYNQNLKENSPLVEGENLILSVKPKKSAYILNQILTMMPIALIWLAFDSMFIIGTIFGNADKKLWLMLIPFFALHLMPVWIWLANVLSANKKWQNTKYYVTDKRIIIQNGFIAENYQTLYYKDIKNVYMRRGFIDQILKVGDIYFDLGYNTKAVQNAVFVDLENANEVYQKIQKIVLDIQTDIEYPNALRPEENPGYNTKYKG